MVHDGEANVQVDQIDVSFDDERLVANAGTLLPVTLAERLGLRGAAAKAIDLGDARGRANPAGKVFSLVTAMASGADSIDDCDVVRSGATGKIMPVKPYAPSTLGTFLRSFTFGHVRQLDRLLDEMLGRAWQAGAGPGDERLVIDCDSFIGEVSGHEKQGASYGYTKELGYHPLVATRADTGETLHIRLRRGNANTQRGITRFVDELIARVRRCGAQGQIHLRADSGFFSWALCERLEAKGLTYSIGIAMQKSLRRHVCEIPEADWQEVIDYPMTGLAQVAETQWKDRRLIVRRVRTLEGQQELFPDWRYFAFVTNREESTQLVDSEHRNHAVIELAIRDLKDQALAHFPSGRFFANAAWTVLGALAHNLLRWTTLIGLPGATVRQAQTVRRRLLSMPGRLASRSRRFVLHLPARWPWRREFLAALGQIRLLPKLE